MNRRNFLKVLGVAAVAPAIGISCEQVQVEPQLSILHPIRGSLGDMMTWSNAPIGSIYRSLSSPRQFVWVGHEWVELT